MRLLLDTHSFLWFIGGDERLSSTAKEVISNLDNAAFLSVASLWEMAIKINIGKLRLPEPFGTLIPEQLAANEFELLRQNCLTLRHTSICHSTTVIRSIDSSSRRQKQRIYRSSERTRSSRRTTWSCSGKARQRKKSYSPLCSLTPPPLPPLPARS